MVKKTFNVDPKLLKAAREAVGGKTATETIQLGLEELVRTAAMKRLVSYFGSEPDAKDVPRRREAPKGKRKVA